MTDPLWHLVQTLANQSSTENRAVGTLIDFGGRRIAVVVGTSPEQTQGLADVVGQPAETFPDSILRPYGGPLL